MYKQKYVHIDMYKQKHVKTQKCMYINYHDETTYGILCHAQIYII